MIDDFPDDKNGDVLRWMREYGDDLAMARGIDFTVVFSSESHAEQFRTVFSEKGYKTSIEKTDSDPEYPWDVVVVKHMLPSHEDIGQFESELQDIASRFDGFNGGWCCFVQKPSGTQI